MKLFVLVHVFKLFTEEFFQIPMEKTNEKITSGTKATEDVGSYCYGLLQRHLSKNCTLIIMLCGESHKCKAKS